MEPEILDTLPPDDPVAQRSRRDLVRINAVMGNARWIKRALATARAQGVLDQGAPITEVGAGDGRLASALAGQGYEVTAIDLTPKPATCSPDVRWIQEDVRTALSDDLLRGSILLACLFWHHLQEDDLAHLQEVLPQFRGILATEPWRARFTVIPGAGAVPLVNHVTRHDLFVSLRAGFRPGELVQSWSLTPDQWQLEETTTLLGAYRLQAWRRNHGN